MILRNIPVYKLNTPNFKTVDNGEFLKDKFYLSFPLLPSGFEVEKKLFELPGALVIKVINRSFDDGLSDTPSIHKEGCFYFNESNEWIIEVIFNMQSKDKVLKHTFTMRLPLSAVTSDNAAIGLLYDGAWLRFIMNGEVLNQSPVLDEFCPVTDDLYLDELFKGATVSKADELTVSYKTKETHADAGFFFPYGWNANIGDVMNFYHNGVYHLIYLLDRKHHGSGPCGSHYICHLTSEDLINWTEQKPIAEIDFPWKSYGTGTMFFHKGKYYMSYGLHTERYEDGREKITPAYNKEKNEFEIIDFESVLEKGGLPTGASFSVSDDGINFTPSNLLTHASRNPSAYIEDGKVTLYCGYGGEGVYESEDMYKPFKSVKKKFDFGKSVMKNSTECPAMFCWNGYKYLIVGFTGYFRALTKNSDELVDAAALGEYIYDGLSVPMVAEFKNNRRLIAGWVHSVLGWGGALMQRELVQFEDGRLGMKWIPELIPQTNGKNLIKSSLLGGKINLSKEESYLFEADVDSLDCEKIAFSFDDGKTACSLELDFIKKRVQINDCEINKFAQALPTPLEALAPLKDMEVHAMHSGITNIPQFAKNYALPDACGQNEHFKLRMTLRRSKKMRGTVLDVELAARKTLISVRDDFFPTSLSLICQGAAKIHNEKLFNISFEE